MVKFWLILFILFLSFRTFCQEIKLPERIINIAEELASNDSDPEAVAIYTERLQELADSPVKLNSSREEEIARLFFLSDFQVKILADYVHSSGRIVSVYELGNIPGFDRETAEMIIPFITLETKLALDSDSSSWRNSSITNISFKSGNNDTIDLGSPLKLLTKYKFSAGPFSGGMTAEKDPGEKLLYGSPPLPDFLSASFAYKGNGILRKLIAGDFSARFGMGTNINTGIRSGLSLTSPGYMSANDEIRSYTSTDENNFFRGVAAEFSDKNLGLILFYSKNYSDATLSTSPDSSGNYIENFYQAGIHNTSRLLQKKDNIADQFFGINVSYNLKNIKAGFTYSGEKFSLPLIQDETDPSKIFSFRGDRVNIFSIYYNTFIKRILLFGELSENDDRKVAFVQGISFRPSDRLTINFLFRNYDPGYTCFHGKSIGAGSSTGNEKGMLGNFSFEAAKNLFISGGCDIEEYPWLKYRCSSPSRGLKQEIRFRYLPSRKLSIDGLFSNRITTVNDSEPAGIPGQLNITTKSYKCSFRYILNEYLTIGSRADYKIADPMDSRGMLLLQDLNYRFRHLPVSIYLRYCIFNTETWDSRIYTFENDLLNSYSIPALYGEGSRSYLLINWEVSKNAELRVRYSATSMINKDVTSAETREYKMQFRVMF